MNSVTYTFDTREDTYIHTKKIQNYLLEGKPPVVQASPAR